MSDQLLKKLLTYRNEKNLVSKGQLAVIVQLTRMAKDKGFPLKQDDLVMEKKGQVRGLGKATLQKILADYGITRVLAEEGGRTSRGSMRIMQDYIAFLNNLQVNDNVDLQIIEAWWIDRVKEFFQSKPFILRYDTSRTIRAIVRDLLAQAEDRQKESPGTTYMGTVLQHLVGAKLSLILPEGTLEIHGASVADSPTARSGDFIIDGVVIHCTTAPGEALMQKCQRNINSGLRPIIVTTYSRLIVAESLASDIGLDSRVEVWDIEQFLATNIYELSFFKETGRKVTVEKIIEAYNLIIDAHETDPSLKIEIS